MHAAACFQVYMATSVNEDEEALLMMMRGANVPAGGIGAAGAQHYTCGAHATGAGHVGPSKPAVVVSDIDQSYFVWESLWQPLEISSGL